MKTVNTLKEGQIIRFEDGDVGVVLRTGRTLLHGHPYAKIKYFFKSEVRVCTTTTKFVIDTGMEFKVIGKLK